MPPEYRHGTSDNPKNREGRFVPVDEIPDSHFLDPEQALLAKEAKADGSDEQVMTAKERQHIFEKKGTRAKAQEGAGDSSTLQSRVQSESIGVSALQKRGVGEVSLRVSQSSWLFKKGRPSPRKPRYKDHRPRGSSFSL